MDPCLVKSITEVFSTVSTSLRNQNSNSTLDKCTEFCTSNNWYVITAIISNNDNRPPQQILRC